MRAVSLIEPLEDRIAPAGALPISNHGKTATFVDAAGDLIVVTTSKGSFNPLVKNGPVPVFTFNPAATGQLAELNLSGFNDFTGANLSFTIIPMNGGSPTVDVGYIDALNLSLGNVTVQGDLGAIDVGSGKTSLALGKLTVQSLGVQAAALAAQKIGVDDESNIIGAVKAINVSGNLDAFIFVQDLSANKVGTGNIGQLNVGGSLDGNTALENGVVFFTGTLSNAVIQGGIEGGSGPFSGSIGGYTSIGGGYGSLSRIGSISVLGSVPDDPNPNPLPGLPGTSILGGSGQFSGEIAAVSIGSVFVAGDVAGGMGAASGGIQAATTLGKVTIAGSLIGGNFAQGSPSEASFAGFVFAGNSLGSVTIEQNLYGGSGLKSGEVSSNGTIQKVIVMGDVAGGSAGTSTQDGEAGSINGHAIGSVIIDGSLIGGNAVNGDPNQAADLDGVIISDTSIGSIYIGKNLIGGSGPSGNNSAGPLGQIVTISGGLGALTIGGADASDGSMIGGAGAWSASVTIAGPVGKMTLTHDLLGGSGSDSGFIQVNGQISSLMIGGNVTGGTGDFTGNIADLGFLSNAVIKGGITGKSSGATMLVNSGYIQANGIGTMVVGGALTSGTAGPGGIDTSGAIRSMTTIGSLTIGSLVGNATNAAVISAVGQLNLIGNVTSNVAIDKITVLGDAMFADILAGYNTNTQNGPLGTGVSADAQIGSVTIGGNIGATNIIAGVMPDSNGQFGTAGSAALSGAGVSDLPSIVSAISKIVIAGSVTTPVGATGTYGIAAQYIGSASVGGSTVPLAAGPDNDTFAADAQHPLAGISGDIFLYEV